MSLWAKGPEAKAARRALYKSDPKRFARTQARYYYSKKGLQTRRLLRESRKLDPFWVARGIYDGARRGARTRGLDFSIDFKSILGPVVAGRCQVTGKAFEFGKGPKHPWMPSIDRIDNAKGYIHGNVQVVLFAYNICKYTWGEEVLLELASLLADARGVSR